MLASAATFLEHPISHGCVPLPEIGPTRCPPRGLGTPSVSSDMSRYAGGPRSRLIGGLAGAHGGSTAGLPVGRRSGASSLVFLRVAGWCVSSPLSSRPSWPPAAGSAWRFSSPWDLSHTAPALPVPGRPHFLVVRCGLGWPCTRTAGKKPEARRVGCPRVGHSWATRISDLDDNRLHERWLMRPNPSPRSLCRSCPTPWPTS